MIFMMLLGLRLKGYHSIRNAIMCKTDSAAAPGGGGYFYPAVKMHFYARFNIPLPRKATLRLVVWQNMALQGD